MYLSALAKAGSVNIKLHTSIVIHCLIVMVIDSSSVKRAQLRS
ncbi:hypothetical protein BMY_0133 [Wohlfahrtiimonas chitiniclastica]|nr:hypothetical protein BMY_0133 [Wohlfahrtiimonas chitiniclastica]